ncbi:MAG: ATP-dependent DNA helicase RecQ [Dehalococcoidia bacterium]|nr:ATP-dependent DNA helicase RecQ [Dehalococcoidia bacterium]
MSNEAAAFSSDLEPYRRTLRQTFGFPELRDGQADVLTALASEDVLAVMPTGSGKSLCYVLPALEVGRTLVVSPLIALMQDQVEGLNAAGVAATFINSNVPRDDRNARYLDFVEGRVPLLYLSPEGLRNERLVAGLRRGGVQLLAIDEAHCISQWGHDFRPDYLMLDRLREQLGRPRTLALTATADPKVRRDVLERLGIAGAARQVVTSFDRPNLRFAVVPLSGVPERQAWLLDYIAERPGQTGIVYVRTRRNTEDVAGGLRAAGVRAEAYHAGMERGPRSAVQRRFTLGETPVIVATNAFGMGIDKPDVRFVIHFNLPGRVESYYQEAGRAGRDGDPADCILLYARRDRAAQQRFIEEAYPDDGAVRELWQRWVSAPELARGDGPNVSGIVDSDGFINVLTALRASGLVADAELRPLSADPDAPIDTRAIAEHHRHAEGRLAQMSEYAETSRCRRAVILRYFGEHPPDDCGNCDACLGLADDAGPSYPHDLYAAIVELRTRLAESSGREPYEVFETRTVEDLATHRPQSDEELLETWGIAAVRARWFGEELLRLVADWEQANPDAPERAARTTSPTRSSSRSRAAAEAEGSATVSADDPLYRRLREWRLDRARTDGVPAYTLFSDRTLRDLVAKRPRDGAALREVWGLGDSRVERFGGDLLAVINEGDG